MRPPPAIAAPARQTRRNLILSLLAGAALSGAALWFAFRNVPLRELAAYLGEVNYLWVIPSVALVILSFGARTWRWQLMLGATRPIGFTQAWHPLMIGFMLNCTLPGRMGEVARPALLATRDRYPFGTALATVATERLLDAGCLLALFALVAATVTIQPELSIPFGGVMLDRQTLAAVARGITRLAVVMLAGMTALALDPGRRIIERLLLWLPRLAFGATPATQEKLRERFCRPLVRFSHHFAAGLAFARHPRNLLLCLGLTAAVWALTVLAYHSMALGCPGLNLTLAESTAGMVIICLFIALPSVPGYWGLWEAGGVFALAIFGVGAREAAGFTLVNHAVQLLPVMLMGFYSVGRIGINFWHLLHQRQLAEQSAAQPPSTQAS
jgi:hypothetical protein